MSTERWNIDTAHSNVEFVARHLVVTKVRGHFGKWSAHIDIDKDDVTKSSASATFEIDSIDTREAQRDGHLKSPDFLDAANYPTLTFVSKKVEVVDETHGRIIGDLTIRGVTNEVVLNTEYNGQSKSPWGTTSAGFSAETKISRKDWGLAWNAQLETGGVLVGDEVKISLEVEAIRPA